MTTAEVVETSVTVNNNSPIQDYVHADDQTQPTFEVFILFEVRNSHFHPFIQSSNFLSQLPRFVWVLIKVE